MNTQDKQHVVQQQTQHGGEMQVRFFVIGRAGVAIAEELISRGFNPNNFVGIYRGDALPASSPVLQRVVLPVAPTPDTLGWESPEVQDRVKAQLGGSKFVFVVAALGGLTGREIAPVVAKLAKDMGHVVFGFVTLPFDCEGSLRQSKACAALQLLKNCADGVLCLPNQKLWKLIPENMPLPSTFKISGALLADAIHGLWRMLVCKGLIDIHLTELCMVIGGPDNHTAFGVADVSGQNRARKAVEKLLATPTLDSGQALRQAEAVVVGVFGGADLSMAEVNSVVEQIARHCPNIPLITGAAIDESLGSRLVVVLFAGRNLGRPAGAMATQTAGSTSASTLAVTSQTADLELHLIQSSTIQRPHSRAIPPPPELTQEKMQELLSKQNLKGPGAKIPVKLRQGQLKLEIISKGRFDKSEPTIYKGEDLDLPTYLRRGVRLN